jgi:ubiquinone/menaquinone biosynthesis C-methylase UbiE
MEEQALSSEKNMKTYYRNLFNRIPEYWDSIYSAESFYGQHYRYRKASIERLLDRADIRQGGRILDVGCGAGGFFPVYFEMQLSVVGIDAAEGMVSQAREIYSAQVSEGTLELRSDDIEDLDLPSDSFDAVNCAGVLMYLPDIDNALSEIYRVLKPGGVATLNTDNHRTFSTLFDLPIVFTSLLRKLGISTSKRDGDGGDFEGDASTDKKIVTRTYPPDEFRRRVRQHGFEILAEAGDGFDRLRLNGRQLLPDSANMRIYKWLGPLYRLRPVGRMGMTYTLLVRKPIG